MEDVVVNIEGNASGLKDALNDVANTINGINNQLNDLGDKASSIPTQQAQSPATGQSRELAALPNYDTIVADIRREMQNRGALMVPGSANWNTLLKNVVDQQRKQAIGVVDERFTQRTISTQQEHEEKRKIDLQSLEEQRNKKISTLEDERAEELSRAKTSIATDVINNRFDERIKRADEEYERDKKKTEERWHSEIAEAGDRATEDYENEKKQVEKELADVIKQLTQELKREGGDSYLGRLRSEYNQAIAKRDTAQTEDEAIEAAREAAEIKRRMERAMRGDGGNNPPDPPDTPLSKLRMWGSAITSIGGIGIKAYQAYLANEQAEIAEVRAAAQGDILGAMMQDWSRRRNNAGAWGAGIGGAVGVGIGAASGGWIGAGLGAGIGSGVGNWIGTGIYDVLEGKQGNRIRAGQLWLDHEKQLAQYNNLIMQVRPEGGNIDEIRKRFIEELGGVEGLESKLVGADLGYTSAQVAQLASQRIARRGYTTNSDLDTSQALDSDALEKVYNMSSGSISNLSAYDRFGNDAIQDVANLVASLSSMGTLGMSGGRAIRTNEFVGYQTQLMEQQRSMGFDPNSEFAQRQLLALQGAFGDRLDNRAMQGLSQINNALVNPREGMTKTLTYEVIQDLFPQTSGDLQKIKEKQYSENPQERAAITQAMINKIQEIYGDVHSPGGMMALSDYTGIQNPHMLYKFIDTFSKPLPEITEGDIASATSGMEDYTQQLTKDTIKMQNETINEINVKLGHIQQFTDTMMQQFFSDLKEIINGLK